MLTVTAREKAEVFQVKIAWDRWKIARKGHTRERS
jgi:hypothetical protein